MNQVAIKKKNPILKIGVIIAFIVFLLYALSLLFPFVWLAINSLRSVSEWGNLVTFEDHAKPLGSLEFSNYLTILTYDFNGDNILSMVGWSVVLTVLGTVINVFFSACAAYVMAKYEFKGKKIIYALAIFAMVVPIVGTLPAQVKFMEFLHLDDSFLGVLFLYSGAFGFNFILLNASFESVSWSYAEAAQMDGAGHFGIFFKVMIPMCRGPIISCCILQAITLWNDYSTPYLFMNSHKTLAVGLQDIQFAYSESPEKPLVFAAMIISILPVVILFACFQKKIIENTVAGGLKG